MNAHLAHDFPLAAHITGAVALDAVQTKPLAWLWPGRIPLGRVTLLASDPGLGKSLVTLDIAARITRGNPWPDEERQGDKETGRQGETSSPSARSLSPCLPVSPSSVLLLSAEDDLADTIRPRLDAMGADCSRIVAIPPISDGPLPPFPFSENDRPRDAEFRAFELRRDLARIRRLLQTMPDCRLVVVDPISAYLGNANEHSNAGVRSLMLPLAALARRFNVAVIAVSHLRKKEGAAIHRTMGSLAFVAAARAGWVLAKDPDEATRRFMLPIKNNLGPDASGLAFTIESLSLPLGEGRVSEGDSPRRGEGAARNINTPSPNSLPRGEDFLSQPVLRWSPEPIAVTAEALLGNAGRPPGRPDHERQQAIDWLAAQLAASPQPAEDLREKSAACGFSEKTLRRAFRELGGEAVREGAFPFGQWLWKLPAVDGQNPGGRFWPSTQKHDDFAPTLSHDS